MSLTRFYLIFKVKPVLQPITSTTVKKNVKTKTSSPPKALVESCKESREAANATSTTTTEEIDSLLDFHFSTKICESSRKLIPDGIK
jgi:hypothetical protein